jgi:hypothetical protein
LIVDSLIVSLKTKFKVGANEELHHFLSIKITRDIPKRLLYMNQSHYINEISNKFLDKPLSTVSAKAPTD